MTEAKTILSKCRKDSVFFIKEVLGTNVVTPQQVQVCRSVETFRRTAVPSGHGVGKTHLAARIALQRLYCYPHSKVVTTAPTWHQVENLLWKELRLAHKASVYPLGGNLLTTELDIDEDWFALGLSTNDAVRFQGIHAPYVTVILDEAVGVDKEIWEAAEGIAVGPNDRFLAIGNPTDPTSEFKRACDSPLWNVVRLNAEEHPNVVTGQIVIPGAVTKEWIDERVVEYGGRDTALYRARVLGLFPEQGDDMLISLADVERAQDRWIEPIGDPDALGVDVARFGSDETVECPIFDGVDIATVGRLKAVRGQNTMQTAGSIKANPAHRKAVDDAGVGGGVTDRLNELDVDIIAYNAGNEPFDKERFLNRRAESWWMVREALKAGEMSLPPDNKLAADLTNIKYMYTSKGQIKLEEKAKIKERTGRSPDRGDALVIAWYARTAPVFSVTDSEKQTFASLSFGSR